MVTILMKLNSKIEQQSGMLNELLRYARKTANIVEKPQGTPDFPLQTVESFYTFETSLETDTVLRDYMVRSA